MIVVQHVNRLLTRISVWTKGDFSLWLFLVVIKTEIGHEAPDLIETRVKQGGLGKVNKGGVNLALRLKLSVLLAGDQFWRRI